MLNGDFPFGAIFCIFFFSPQFCKLFLHHFGATYPLAGLLISRASFRQDRQLAASSFYERLNAGSGMKSELHPVCSTAAC
jgi:hypothetical protein